MDDAVNMSLDEIIKQNKQHQRTSRSRGRGGGGTGGGGNVRGRGGFRGGGNVRGRGGPRGRGRGAGGGQGRGRSQSRSGTPGPQQGRSRSRGPNNGYRSGSQPRSRSQSRARSRSRARSQSRARSRSNQRNFNFNFNNRASPFDNRARSASRSRSRSRLRGLTPRGRAGLEEQLEMPQLITNRRGGMQTRLRRSNSNPNLQNGSVHSRLGMTTRRGRANLRSPLGARGMARGVSKRGRGFTTGNRYSNIGLRSDQILREQQMINNIIKSQTFRRSRNNSFNASQLTVSVANNNFNARKRRNSVGNEGYLNRQSLAQLNYQFGGYNNRRGPSSVKSMGSNRSNRSSRSNRSNHSNRSNRSRGRGRGGNRGVGRKFVNKQILNPKLQKEIAAIQGKSAAAASAEDPPSGINFAPTPNATTQTLHQRFASK